VARTRTRSILIVLFALAAPSAADTACQNLPSAPCPALAAAPLVYLFVESPLGSGTWAERQMEAIRLGSVAEVHEDGSAVTSYVLLSLHTPTAVNAYALEMMEAPPDTPAAAQDNTQALTMSFGEPRLVGALEAMGLRPEDLVDAQELPDFAVTLADVIANLSALIFREGPRDRRPGTQSLAVAPESRYTRPDHVRFQKPPEPDRPPNPDLRLYAKQITRSIYKVLLGIAIGVLIWGFVRNTA